jgi:hypothetical protein
MLFSGMRRHYTLAKIKNREKPPYSPSEMETRMFWLLPIWQGGVSMFKMSAWLSTSRWPAPSKRMCIGLEELGVQGNKA